MKRNRQFETAASLCNAYTDYGIAAFRQRFLHVKWTEGGVKLRSLQCRMLNSETFLGGMNANVTNLLGNSHYFVDKSGFSEKL